MRETPFRDGTLVVVYLANPPEKIWGVLRTLDTAGVTVEGLDLRSFEDCIRGILAGEIGARDLSTVFFPLARVEKILLDEGSATAPSLGDQFRARVGRGIAEFLER